MLVRKTKKGKGMHEDILKRFSNNSKAKSEIEELVLRYKINSTKVNKLFKLVS